MSCEILCCLYTERSQLGNMCSAIVIAICRFQVHFTQHIEPKLVLKGQCHEIFDFRFFHETFFSQAPEYPIRCFSNFFENSRKYLSSTCTTSVTDTGDKWKKSSIRKVLIGHNDLRISLWFFETIQNDPLLFSEAWGKMIDEKNLKQKILLHYPFK
jgi:hypothetical protein